MATKRVLAALLFVAYINFSLVSGAPTRQRRSLWELNTIIGCYTGRSAIENYNGYGCWCGIGGSGKPVDKTDRCCEYHDICYGVLQNNRCGVYFSSYSYIKHDCNTGQGYVSCTSDNGCERALCECDRRLAKCLASVKKSYHDVFANFEKRLCDFSSGSAADLGTYDYNSLSSTLTIVEGSQRDAYQIDTAPVANLPEIARAENIVPDAIAPADRPNVQVPAVVVGVAAVHPNQTHT